MSTAVSYTLRTQCTHRSCQPCHLAPGNPIYVATLLCCYSGFAGASVLSWAFVGADVCADAVLYSAPSNLLNCLPGQFSVLKNCWATLRRISEPRGSACPTISVILRDIVFPDDKEHRCRVPRGYCSVSPKSAVKDSWDGHHLWCAALQAAHQAAHHLVCEARALPLFERPREPPEKLNTPSHHLRYTNCSCGPPGRIYDFPYTVPTFW